MLMGINRRHFLATPGLASVALAELGCANWEQGDHVLATTTLVGDLARHLLPPEVPVILLMGPGIDPHTYEPTARTVAHIRQARLIVGHGLHLEGRLTQLLEATHEQAIRRVFLVTRHLETAQPDRLRQSDGQWDPHIWFDAELWSDTIPPLAMTLAEVYPRHSGHIEENKNFLRSEFNKLHREMLERVKAIPPARRILITSHDAFGYLGQAYGLEVHAIQGISTAGEVSESSLRELANLAVEREVSVGFLESTVSPRTLEKLRALIRARSGKTAETSFRLGGELFSDSLGGAGSGAETYLSMMRHNLEVISGALSNG